MREEREIRPKWPAIYTFLGRGKWWQRRTSSVVRWSNKFGCSMVEQVRWFISNRILLALARMSSAFCFLFASCCLLCGWDCFHVLMPNHHMPISNKKQQLFKLTVNCAIYLPGLSYTIHQQKLELSLEDILQVLRMTVVINSSTDFTLQILTMCKSRTSAYWTCRKSFPAMTKPWPS